MVYVCQEEAVIDCIVLGHSWVAKAVAHRLETTAVPLILAERHLGSGSMVVHADTCPNLDNPLGAWRWVLRVAALRCIFHYHHWIQCSSPYVLAGAGHARPYSASAERRPLGFEGEISTALEWCLLRLGTQTTIVRSGLLYDDAPGSLLQWAIDIVRAGLGQAPSMIVSPTPVDLFAKAIETLVRTRAVGIYHAACRGQASYLDIARETARHLGLPTPILDLGTEPPINLGLTSTTRMGWWQHALHERLADLTKGS